VPHLSERVAGPERRETHADVVAHHNTFHASLVFVVAAAAAGVGVS
jgi:hypothetical protein